MNRTKIMVTIGPASWDEKTLERLILAGVSSCRINFAHASYDKAEETIALIRRISKRLNRSVAVRQDLQGPKIRVGELERDSYELSAGHQIVLSRKECRGSSQKISIVQPEFLAAMEPGAEIVIGDNDLKLAMLRRLNEDEILCEVTIPGFLRPRKGACAPGTRIPFQGMTEKDIRDLEFGIAQKVDCVSMSFVQTTKDIKDLKAVLARHNAHIPVIAKIEQRNALDNLDEILDCCDGLSAARGDLAVERPLEELHLIDKEIIRRANLAGKFVFTGSGILKSLMKNPWPTRAEVCDVSSLVMDGIDAISFSDETAVGEDPVGCVRTLYKIIERTEEIMMRAGIAPAKRGFFQHIGPDFGVSWGEKPLALFVDHLESAARMAKMHYAAPVVAAVQDMGLANFIAHYWGVYPICCPSKLSRGDCVDYAVQEAVRIGILRDAGDVNCL